MEVEIREGFAADEEGPLRADFKVCEELAEEFAFWETDVD